MPSSDQVESAEEAYERNEARRREFAAAKQTLSNNYDDWVRTYKPEKNNIVLDDREYDGFMFETFGPEINYVTKIAQESPKRVWTLITGDEGGWFISSGLHFVNRIGHFITSNPCGDDEIEFRVADDDERPLTIEKVMEALKEAIDDAKDDTYTDNLGDGESIIIDGTINLVVLTSKLNDLIED